MFCVPMSSGEYVKVLGLGPKSDNGSKIRICPLFMLYPFTICLAKAKIDK